MILLNHYACLFACLLACSSCGEENRQEDTPRIVEKIAVTPEKQAEKPAKIARKASKMDTSKAIFKTVPLAPLKTHIQALKNDLEAGKTIKIVCYGNSITNGYRTGTFGKVENPYPEMLGRRLRALYPKTQIEVRNEGHNGWRSNQALNNVHALVLPEKPDWVILELGINDAYSSFSPAVFVGYMQKLVQALQEKGAKVLLMTATPIATQYHEKVLAYHAPLRAMAEASGCAFFDLSTYIAQRAERAELTAKELLPDDIHFADDKYSWISEGIIEFLR